MISDATSPSPVIISMMKSNANKRARRNNPIFQYNKPFNESIKVYEYTPSAIARQIYLSHRNRVRNPNADYFSQYSANLSTLSMDNFHKFCQVKMNVDSGANVFSVQSRNLLVVFFEVETTVDAVDGHQFTAPGWGVGIILLNGKPRMIAPVYECPDNPQNTFSPGALKLYSSFTQVLVDCHNKLIMKDNNGRVIEEPLIVDNGLDFCQVQFLIFSDNMLVDPRNHSSMKLTMIPRTTTVGPQVMASLNLPDIVAHKEEFIFPRKVMNIIGYYFVSIHNNNNPRSTAINSFNQLLYPYLNHDQSNNTTNLNPTIPAINAFDAIANDVNTEIRPILGKMYR